MPPRPALLPLLLLLSGCEGEQSALSPAGRDAEQIATLWWWMAGSAIAIWAVVVGAAIYAVRARVPEHSKRVGTLIIGGGVAFPTVVLAVLLLLGLRLMPDLLDPGPEGGLRIRVVGEQWWWRVQYQAEDGRVIELANELRLPVGKRVPILLESIDVIHAFWVPSLAGKIDMIPGRVNRIALQPQKTGRFRGACAEYCGASHAKMSFYTVVEEQADFEAWLRAQQAPAAAPQGALAEQGARLFLANGCGACHSIRGTAADGLVGPDLTHVGSRISLGAGILENDRETFRRWIAHPDHIKPGARMPGFSMLPDADLDALAAYMDGLE